MAGAPRSFDAVYDECHRSVYSLCRSLIGDPDDAADAVQDTFLAVARALPRFRGESSVKTWVHRIAIRTALRCRGRLRLHDALDDQVASGDRVCTQRLDVARALATLSTDHQVVLAMFAVEGMTHPEIGEILGIPEGTVWSRLHAAKRRLAAALAGTAGEPR